MAWCLLRSKAKELKQAIADGKVDIYELKDMTSSERRDYFKQWVSEEDAKQINLEYEKKLTLKNYERAMVSWASKVTGITQEKKRDLQNRVQNMIKRGELTADNLNTKMEDLINYRLGGEVSTSEANEIFKLSEQAKKYENWTNEEERQKYGEAVYNLQQYAADISAKAPKTKAKYFKQAAFESLALPRSIMASMDLSALFGQGLMLSTTKQWRQNAFGLDGKQSILKLARSQEAYDRSMADIISRPNYDLAVKSGLRITQMNGKLTQREETFMSTAAEKIPFIGSLIKGSDRAYSGFLNQLRMDTFDKLINDAELNGEDVRVGSKAAQEAAIIVNNMTGAGNFMNKRTVNPWLSQIFFSPRRIASTINNVNPYTYVSLQSNTVRKFAIARLLSFAGIIAAIAGLAKASPDDELDFEMDIRSANFGKLRVGRRWYDITGGHARFLNALWVGGIGGVYTGLGGENDLLFGKKNSTTGAITPTGDGKYDTNASKEIMRYIRNKTAPIPGFFWGLYSKDDFKGDKFEPSKELANMFIPMSMGDIVELNNGTITGTEAIMGIIPNIFGVNSLVYTNIPNWHIEDTEEIKQLREKLSDKELTEAEKLYGELYTQQLDALVRTAKYKELDNEEKRKAISDLGADVKKQVFAKYNFKPKRNKKKK